MGLVPDPPGRIVGGSILFRMRDGSAVDLTTAARRGSFAASAAATSR